MFSLIIQSPLLILLDQLCILIFLGVFSTNDNNLRLCFIYLHYHYDFNLPSLSYINLRKSVELHLISVFYMYSDSYFFKEEHLLHVF